MLRELLVCFSDGTFRLEAFPALIAVVLDPRRNGTFGIAASMLGLELSIEGPALLAL